MPLSDNIASTQSFGDGGGLKYQCWESCDNLWRFPADVAQCSPNAEDGTPTGAKDFSSARAAYLSSRTDTLYARARECEKRLRVFFGGRMACVQMGVCPPIYKISGGHTGGGTLPGGGLRRHGRRGRARASRPMANRRRCPCEGADWRKGPPVRGLTGAPPGWLRGPPVRGLTGAPPAG